MSHRSSGLQRTLEFISLNLTDAETEGQREDKARVNEMTESHQQTYEYLVANSSIEVKFEMDGGHTENVTK